MNNRGVEMIRYNNNRGGLEESGPVFGEIENCCFLGGSRREPAPRAWPGQAGATGRGISRTFPFILPTPASPGHLQVYL